MPTFRPRTLAASRILGRIQEKARSPRSLGTGRVGGEERPTGADPKDRIEVAEAFQLARLAVRLDWLERAEELLIWAVEVDPGNVACRRLLGRVHLDQERFDESLATAPSAGQAWRRAGRLRARTGDREGAKEALRRAAKLLGSPPEDAERPGGNS